MLVEKPILTIRPKHIPFEYRTTIRPAGIIYKWYNTDTPYEIEEVEVVSDFVRVMVLIKQGHNYLWCPFVDDLVKEAKVKSTKRSILRSIVVVNNNGRYIIECRYKGKIYTCYQVVKIKVNSIKL